MWIDVAPSPSMVFDPLPLFCRSRSKLFNKLAGKYLHRTLHFLIVFCLFGTKYTSFSGDFWTKKVIGTTRKWNKPSEKGRAWHCPTFWVGEIKIIFLITEESLVGRRGESLGSFGACLKSWCSETPFLVFCSVLTISVWTTFNTVMFCAVC